MFYCLIILLHHIKLPLLAILIMLIYFFIYFVLRNKLITETLRIFIFALINRPLAVYSASQHSVIT